jgi:hypothetical protein
MILKGEHSEENISQCYFTHHGDWLWLKSGPQIWVASDVLQYWLMTPFPPVVIFDLLLQFPVKFEHNFLSTPKSTARKCDASEAYEKKKRYRHQVIYLLDVEASLSLITHCINIRMNAPCARYKLIHKFIAVLTISSVQLSFSYYGTLKFVTFSDRRQNHISL